MKLRASLMVASVLIALGATANAGIVPVASEGAPLPSSLYSPASLAGQPIALHTSRAMSADYFAPPVYGASGPVSRFETGPITDARSFAPAEASSASLPSEGTTGTL